MERTANSTAGACWATGFGPVWRTVLVAGVWAAVAFIGCGVAWSLYGGPRMSDAGLEETPR